ncbi:MAG: HDOD domain-containing protein [Planctomycetota bacterium]
MTEIFLGRQPILDAASNLFAYELLFRGSEENQADFADANQASASVILNTFIEIGLENVVGKHEAFVRMTDQFMQDELFRSLPPHRTVLLLPEDARPDGRTLAAVKNAVDQGYRTALSNYRGQDDFEPLLDLASFLKVDCMGLESGEIQHLVNLLQGRNIRLIADRVETQESFSEMRGIGFRYFKGYYFCKPDVMRQNTVPTNRVAVMELLARILDPDVPMARIQEIIERNVSLSYRILRYVNSALYSFPRRIESIRHAISLLGLERVRDCLSLSLLAEIDDKPLQLSITALVRARTCQLLARSMGNLHESVFFSAGLLSVLDAILDMPMVKVVEVMRLAKELREALLDRSGPAGHALRAALGCENAIIDAKALRVFGATALHQSHVGAIKWVSELDGAMAGTAEPVPSPQ